MNSYNTTDVTPDYTYCPECGKITEEKPPTNFNFNQLCFKCNRNYRPRF